MSFNHYVAPQAESVEVRFESNILSFVRNADNNQRPNDTGEEGF